MGIPIPHCKKPPHSIQYGPLHVLCTVSVCFEAVSAVLCIDHSRVYVTGESNGGMLAHYLVQSLPGGRCGYGMGMSPGSTEVSQKCAFAQRARSPGLVFYHVLYIHAYTHTHIYIYIHIITHKIIHYMLYMYMFLLHMWVFLKMGFPKPSLSIQFHA